MAENYEDSENINATLVLKNIYYYWSNWKTS